MLPHPSTPVRTTATRTRASIDVGLRTGGSDTVRRFHLHALVAIDTLLTDRLYAYGILPCYDVLP